ncbi:hypothetical protein VDGD_00240 [Verticillium dahliae]|nr:hypothetical protein VDGD_00240 [Verticillium dahliae]
MRRLGAHEWFTNRVGPDMNSPSISSGGPRSRASGDRSSVNLSSANRYTSLCRATADASRRRCASPGVITSPTYRSTNWPCRMSTSDRTPQPVCAVRKICSATRRPRETTRFGHRAVHPHPSWHSYSGCVDPPPSWRNLLRSRPALAPCVWYR